MNIENFRAKGRSQKSVGEHVGRGLSPFDWNFDDVPSSELVACCYWEYARESAFFRDLRRRCAEAVIQGKTDWDVYGFLGAEFNRLEQIHPYELVIFDGFFGRMPFPAAWLDLHEPDRKRRADIELDRPLAFQRRGSATTAELLLEQARKHVKEYRAAEDKLHREYPGYGGGTLRRMGKWPEFKENCSVLWDEGTEATIVEIGWEHHTNDQIVDAFRKWVKANRPKDMPKPNKQGHKDISHRVDLERLAIMRLLHRFTLTQLRQKCQPAWKRYNTPNRRWQRDAQKARARFHSLFPFLPATENPLSWPPKNWTQQPA